MTGGVYMDICTEVYGHINLMCTHLLCRAKHVGMLLVPALSATYYVLNAVTK